MVQTIYRLLINVLNRKSISRILAGFARSKMSKGLIPLYSKIYQINIDEMEKSMKEYQTIHEFFTRRLKKEARSIDQKPFSVVSPVDAILQEYGKVQSNHCVIVKGKNYSISEMLGGDEKVEKYVDGTYMIFYLSPSHYHRIHSPVSGEISNQWTIGTKSYPVNSFGLKYGKRPLAKNYRMITEVEHEEGTVAIVKVGAMYINSIETLTNANKLNKGSEMAYFSFGSSVVLLFQAGTFIQESTLTVPRQIKVGECIGYTHSGLKEMTY
ncbi:phosphatidylserine decarboxylase [Niallia sp. Krafla_26]|uniref:phosphatidylserine decarboxylase n=1 Tax=Niallia sp. Krafla_26 TaxID=3064703 RepID=UPI003D163AF1